MVKNLEDFEYEQQKSTQNFSLNANFMTYSIERNFY